MSMSEKGLIIEEQQYEFLAEEFQVNTPPVYRISIPGADGRFYFTFDEDKRPVLLTSGTTIISDGYVDKEKQDALMKFKLRMLQEGRNPDEYVKFRQDFGTLEHVLFNHLLKGERVPLGDYDGCNLEDYVRGLVAEGLAIPESSLQYIFNVAHKELKKDILSFLKWIKDYNVKPLAIELMGSLLRYKVGSAIDLICTIDVKEKVEVETGEVFKRGPNKGKPKTEKKETIVQKLVVVDYKSGKKGFYKTYIHQLHLYRVMLKETFGVEVDGVYNYAGKDWRNEPSYTFTLQDDKDALDFFDVIMQQGKLAFDKKKKTYKVFSGFASVNESDWNYREVDILQELYEIYCPERLHEICNVINKEEIEEVKENEIPDKEVTNIEEEPANESLKEEKEDNKPTKKLKESDWFEDGTIIVRDDRKVFAIYRGNIDGNLATDFAIKDGHCFLQKQIPMTIFGYTERFVRANKEEIEILGKALSQKGIWLNQDGELCIELSNKPISKDSKDNWSMVEVEKDKVEKITPKFKSGDIICKETQYIWIVAEVDYIADNGAVMTKLYWGQESGADGKLNVLDEPQNGIGYQDEFELGDEVDSELLKEKLAQLSKMDNEVTEDEIEKLFDEFDAWNESKGTNSQKDILLKVPLNYNKKAIDILLKALTTKDTARAKSVLLGKQPLTTLCDLYWTISGKEAPESMSKREIQDYLKEIDYNGITSYSEPE